jgi:hypothetical protein
MYCFLADHQAKGIKVLKINTRQIAWVSSGEEGESGPLKVEIGFSGGAVLNLIADQQDWNHFNSVLEKEERAS